MLQEEHDPLEAGDRRMYLDFNDSELRGSLRCM